jgi:hypothetical protein
MQWHRAPETGNPVQLLLFKREFTSKIFIFPVAKSSIQELH